VFHLVRAAKLEATGSGSTVTLRWWPVVAPGAACGYHVYRSFNGLQGFGAPLNAAPQSGLSYTDTGVSQFPVTYQVRACRLVQTGAGAFWDLGQAAFVTVQ
jgi:hypothetical protein